MGGADEGKRLRAAAAFLVAGGRFWQRQGRFLLPICWIINQFEADSKFPAKPFHQRVRSFYLQVGWWRVFAIGYNAYTDSSDAAVPNSAGHNGPLSLPFFRRQNLPIAAAETIADDKMAVNILRAGQSVQRRQLFDITGLGAAVVDFYTAPAFAGLRYF